MAQAQMLSGDALVKALRQGGYVIVMRHASSPREVPDKAHANPDNTKPERQLDETGRTTATAMGKALRDLKIPIGEVLTSPTYRALETIRMEQWANAKPVPELGDNGQSMQGGTEAQAAWLQKEVTQFPSGHQQDPCHSPAESDARFPEGSRRYGRWRSAHLRPRRQGRGEGCRARQNRRLAKINYLTRVVFTSFGHRVGDARIVEL